MFNDVFTMCAHGGVGFELCSADQQQEVYTDRSSTMSQTDRVTVILDEVNMIEKPNVATEQTSTFLKTNSIFL